MCDAKLCGAYVSGIFGALELKGTKYHEALFLDVDGNLAEGAGENIFLVKKGALYTPSRGAILPGITRATVLQLAECFGLGTTEMKLKPQDAFDADEAFFTGTAAEVTPIGAIDDHVIGGGEVGPITSRLRSAYLDLVFGRNPAFRHFLSIA